jgi:hypothetical protein
MSVETRVAWLYGQWRSLGYLLPVDDDPDEWPPWDDLSPYWQHRFLYVLEPMVMRSGPEHPFDTTLSWESR